VYNFIIISKIYYYCNLYIIEYTVLYDYKKNNNPQKKKKNYIYTYTMNIYIYNKLHNIFSHYLIL